MHSIFQKTAVQISRQEIIDLDIDIGNQDDDCEKNEQGNTEKNEESIPDKNSNKNDRYHLQVQDEDMEDMASLATSTSFERSSFRYSLRRRTSKRSINVIQFLIHFQLRFFLFTSVQDWTQRLMT